MGIGLVKDSSVWPPVDLWRFVPKCGYSKKRHARACGVHYAEPNGMLCSAGVAATRLAVRFA